MPSCCLELLSSSSLGKYRGHRLSHVLRSYVSPRDTYTPTQKAAGPSAVCQSFAQTPHTSLCHIPPQHWAWSLCRTFSKLACVLINYHQSSKDAEASQTRALPGRLCFHSVLKSLWEWVFRLSSMSPVDTNPSDTALPTSVLPKSQLYSSPDSCSACRACPWMDMWNFS